MKAKYIYFIVLKVVFILQCLLILLKKQTTDSSIYILTDTVFKLSLAIYIWIFLWFYEGTDISIEDKMILSFSAALIIYDIDYNNIVKYLIELGLPDNYFFRYLNSLSNTKIHYTP